MKKILIGLHISCLIFNLRAMDNAPKIPFDKIVQGFLIEVNRERDTFNNLGFFAEAVSCRDFSEILDLQKDNIENIYSDPTEFSEEQIKFELDHKDFPNYEQWKKEKKGPLYVKVLRDSKLVGVATYFVLDKETTNCGSMARIVDLLISDKSRGKGFGHELLGFVLSDLKNKNVTSVELFALKKNKTACKFYEREGFSRESWGYSNSEQLYRFSKKI